MSEKEINEKISEIIRLDYEMTMEITSGRHMPSTGDKFQNHRDRILELRMELFPDSVWAKGVKKD